MYFNLYCAVIYVLLTLARVGLGEEHIRIGAFNVHLFDQGKVKELESMKTLVKVIQRYDIILIQKVSDETGIAFKELLTQSNRNSYHGYSMEVSPRYDRSEQYGFIYRQSSGLKVKSSFVYDDGEQDAREPYVVHFSAPFTRAREFALVGVRSMPDNGETVKGISALVSVVNHVQQRVKTDNVMVLGDMNATCGILSRDQRAAINTTLDGRFDWLIPDVLDTTVRDTNCAYDRFILTGNSLRQSVVPESANLFHFDQVYQLSQHEAKAVSNHYPIEVELLMKGRSEYNATKTGMMLYICGIILTALVLIVCLHRQWNMKIEDRQHKD